MRGKVLLSAAVAWLIALARKRRGDRRRGDKHVDGGPGRA